MLKKLNNIGDSAIVCDFGEDVNQSINKEVIELFYFIKKQSELEKLEGILNCTPSYNKLIITFDLKKTNAKIVSNFINSTKPTNLDLIQKKKEWNIPICYDFEMDLTNMSKELKLDKEKIISIHLKSSSRVLVLDHTSAGRRGSQRRARRRRRSLHLRPRVTLNIRLDHKRLEIAWR